MPYLVRENLFIGNIGDAAEVLQNGSTEITHILSVLSSASISFFSEWKKGLTIPTKEIKKVYTGGSVGGSASVDDSGDGSKSCLLSDKLLYLLEYAGKDLKLVRMGVPLRDMENENLLDYLDVCLDFIDKSRKEGSVLVHCFAGVSRSAAIITAYLMRTEHLSQQDALGSLRQSCEFVCPNDGFLDQLKMYEEMGFKVDHASPIYKSFRLKVLGTSLFFLLHLPLPLNLGVLIVHLAFMLSYFSFPSFGNRILYEKFIDRKALRSIGLPNWLYIIELECFFDKCEGWNSFGLSMETLLGYEKSLREGFQGSRLNSKMPKV